MATKSFLKTISIKKSYEAKKLIQALENAENKKGKDVFLSRAVNKIEKNEIKDFFVNN